MNYKRSKAMLILFLVGLILFFTSDFELIDIEKTAIIVALGIDKNQNELEVTAQIAIPQATNEQATNSDAIIAASGKTMFDAIENIALKTGWYPKLSFCNLIVFGKEVVEEDFFPLVDYVLTSNRFQNSTILSTTDKSAKEVLSCSTPLDFISSFALQKILLRNVDRANAVLAPDVREFCVDNRSHSAFCYLPIIKIIKNSDDKIKGAEANQSKAPIPNICTANTLGKSSGGKSGSGSNEKNSASEGQTGIFDATNTLFFSRGQSCCVLNEKQSLCYNLLTKKVGECFWEVDFKKNGKQTKALISIVSNKFNLKLTFNNGQLKLLAKLKLICEKEETFLREDTFDLSSPNIVSKEGLNALKSSVYEHIDQLIKLSIENDCDFFGLKNITYQRHNKLFATQKYSLLKKLDYQIEVQAVNQKNN